MSCKRYHMLSQQQGLYSSHRPFRHNALVSTAQGYTFAFMCISNSASQYYTIHCCQLCVRPLGRTQRQLCFTHHHLPRSCRLCSPPCVSRRMPAMATSHPCAASSTLPPTLRPRPGRFRCVRPPGRFSLSQSHSTVWLCLLSQRHRHRRTFASGRAYGYCLRWPPPSCCMPVLFCRPMYSCSVCIAVAGRWGGRCVRRT